MLGAEQLREYLLEEFESFATQFSRKIGDYCHVATGSGKTGNKALSDGIAAMSHDDGNGCRSVFCRPNSSRSMGHNHVHFVVNKPARKFGKLSQLTLCIPIPKLYVSAFSPSKVLQDLAKVGHAGSRLASFRTGGGRIG